MNEGIRVVVADDSPFVCRLLTSYLESSPGIEVVGTAKDGATAVRLVEELRPDVATLDLEMPNMNGLEALEYIMTKVPTPVLLISGTSRRAAKLTVLALDLGAVDFILKYTPGLNTDPEKLRYEIISKARAAAQTRVIRLLKQPEQPSNVIRMPLSPKVEALSAQVDSAHSAAAGLVVIGASTGGPLALKRLLGALSSDFNSAIVVVQHMPGTFTSVLAEQLDRQVELSVKEAEHGDLLEPGRVYVAPGGYHVVINKSNRIELNDGLEVSGHRPSIDLAMQSAAQIYGPLARGVVLTGMGEDGTLGLVAIHENGGKTFAQDAESCIVNGMPQRAIDRGVVDYVASPEEIASRLLISQSLIGRKRVC